MIIGICGGVVQANDIAEKDMQGFQDMSLCFSFDNYYLPIESHKKTITALLILIYLQP